MTREFENVVTRRIVQKTDLFELVEYVGRGAMGTVWRATHRRSGTPVAVKIIDTEPMAGREEVLREVRALAGVEHDGIVRILDFDDVDRFDHEELPREGLYVAMEYAAGGHVEPGEITDWSVARDLLLQVVDALAHIHARDIVHLDLKPANVLRFPQADDLVRYRIADFGIAHVADERGESEGVSGTPAYMPPEQLYTQWRDYGPWTDLYALGCMAWEVTTGDTPFVGGSFWEIAMKHVRADLPDFEPRFAVPERFEDWLRRLLRKEPAERFPSAADAAQRLLMLGAPTFEGTGTESFDPDERPTVVDDAWAETLASGCAPTLAALDVPDLPGAADSAGPEPGATGPPPCPGSWRSGKRARNVRLVDAGLSLFDLRSTPFVGRIAERDELWRVFRQCRESERLAKVVITGRRDVGKTRLTTWWIRRLRELGQAQTVVFQHDRFDTWREAIADGIVRYVRGRDLVGEELVERTRGVLGTDDLTSDLLRAVVDPEQSEVDSVIDVYEVLTQIVRVLAAPRPVVLVFDGVEREPFPLEFVEHLDGVIDGLPVVCAMTVDKDQVTPVVRRRIDELSEGAAVLTLPAMGERIGEFADALLPLGPSERERVLSVAGDDFAFVRQVFARWIERGQLVAGPAGFEAPGSGVPATLEECWADRLRYLARQGGVDEDAVLRPLELAAVLGASIPTSRLSRVADAAGVEISVGAMHDCIRRGWLEYEGESVRFVEQSLRWALLASAERHGRREAFERAAGEYLRDLGSRLALEKAMYHLYRAGDLLDAVEVARGVVARSFGRDGEAINDWIERVLAGRTEPEFVAERIYCRIHRGLNLIHYGDEEAATDLLSQAETELAAEELPAEERDRLRAELEYVRAVSHLFRDEFDEGIQLAEPVLEYFVAAGDEKSTFQTHSLLGDLYLYAGRPQAARPYYEAALEFAQGGESRTSLGWALYRVGSLYEELDELDLAREAMEEAMECFRDTSDRNGLMLASDVLAVVELRAENFDEAQRLWERTIALAESANDPDRYRISRSLASLHARQGHTEETEQYLEIAREGRERGARWVGQLEAIEMEIFAHDGDWEGVASAFERLSSEDAAVEDRKSLVTALRRVVALAERAGEGGLSADVQRYVDELELAAQ